MLYVKQYKINGEDAMNLRRNGEGTQEHLDGKDCVENDINTAQNEILEIK